MQKFPSDTPYVFDNDCLASFLWIKRTDLLQNLFHQQIEVPEPVVTELEFLKTTRFAWVYKDLIRNINNRNFKKIILPSTGSVATEYYKLITAKKPLGRGEAAVLSYVKYSGGTVASNNLSDVFKYCQDNNLSLISTDDILCYACAVKKLITEHEGSLLWTNMKQKRRALPNYSFSEALMKFKKNY